VASLPFGDGQSTTGSCAASTRHFTGKERDRKSNLDYFGARYSAHHPLRHSPSTAEQKRQGTGKYFSVYQNYPIPVPLASFI